MTPDQASESDIRDWCIAYLKRTIDNPAIAVAPDATFAQLGLDSATAAYFIVELEEWLGGELTPELVFDYPTITALAHHLATRPAGGNGGRA